MKIIYKNENDVKEFDKERFLTSLNKYGKVTAEQVDEALKEFEGYDVLHYSVLWSEGVRLLQENNGDAEGYYREHATELPGFERLRRITGRAECCLG